MDTYETEEQQVEAIKKWWADNYKMVIALSIIGLGSIIGVQKYKEQKLITAQTASLEYDHILSSVVENRDAVISQQVDTMLNEYETFPYAALSAMLEAKQMIAAQKFPEAEEKFQWVIKHSQAANLQHIARVRLATLMSAQGKNKAALSILNTEQGKFKASYLEVKGDILVALKRIEDARSAYDQALDAYAAIGANAQILRIKRNDLGNS
jgi:predicted negative regulator of RcsB-dependent stress response